MGEEEATLVVGLEGNSDVAWGLGKELIFLVAVIVSHRSFSGPLPDEVDARKTLK